MTEAELCAEFTKVARANGWEVYAETGGWDLLLVWTGDAPVLVYDSGHRELELHNGPEEGFSGSKLAAMEDEIELAPGDQWGIQAKLRGSFEVIDQALVGVQWVERGRTQRMAAPDFRSVLVPSASAPFLHICSHLRLGVVTPLITDVYRPTYRWTTRLQHTLPPIVPSWTGGAPSPKSLSHWRVQALKICARLRAGEILMRKDFKEYEINIKTFVQRHWILSTGHGQYVMNPMSLTTPDPMLRFPDIGYEAERDALVALEAQCIS